MRAWWVRWGVLHQVDGKEIAGRHAAEFVQHGMRVGLGTGSTVHHTVVRLGERVREGLRFTAVPTSKETRRLAAGLGIRLEELRHPAQLDLAIDGADEVDPGLRLIKGGGGALLREKLVASAARRYVVVVDPDKLVARLGQRPLPVEVVPFGWRATLERLRTLGAEPVLRQQDGRAFRTDNGNRILDCAFGPIADPESLHARLKLLPGVVETGLFVGFADLVVVGDPAGPREIRRG